MNFDQDLLNAELSEFDADMLRIPAIAKELIRGFTFFRGRKNLVTVFGSARLPETDPYYQQARKLGGMLAAAGIGVITGGGPGIMEAASRGAYENNGLSFGVNIRLEMEQHANPYLTDCILMEHFFARKLLLLKYSHAIVIFPGGFGTIDELFEALTLVQTRKLQKFPIVMIGSDYWGGLMDWVRDKLVGHGAIKASDVALISQTDDLNEAMTLIERHTSPP